MIRTVQQVLHISRCNKDIRHFGSVTSSRHSKDRIRLTKKKVASYIYNFCNTLQGKHALYLRSNHKNQDGIKTELIIKTELKSKGDFDTSSNIATV